MIKESHGPYSTPVTVVKKHERKPRLSRFFWNKSKLEIFLKDILSFFVCVHCDAIPECISFASSDLKPEYLLTKQRKWNTWEGVDFGYINHCTIVWR